MGQKATLSSWSIPLFLLIGLVFHIVYLFSIFDIYFRSPLVHGMKYQHLDITPPAKRLVFIVGDGLRADKTFTLDHDGISNAPFLRSIALEKGSFGVSHTRVPTETRPGHVALIAGFYEDVSAVTKGWKENPVEFDSVFNQSRFTWAYGSPDVVPMFSNHIDHMFSETYPPEMENFGASGFELDEWVFGKIRNLLNQSLYDEELYAKLHSDKIIFFLHLLGIDTTGHAYRPYSPEYIENIKLVDEGVEKIYKLFEDYFQDNNTAYVFTSDHGMNNKGAHGDGEKDNTETPIIAWGKGVITPNSKNRHDGRSIFDPTPSSSPSDWKMPHTRRMDVQQADICPLMSTLIGLNYPVNSVGVLPYYYLDTDEDFSSKSLFINALQILEHFQVKSKSKEEFSIFFKPFQPLKNSDEIGEKIRQNIERGLFKEADKQSLHLIELCIQGLSYFQTYDWPFLMTTIFLGYTGWISCVLVFVVNNFTVQGLKSYQARENRVFNYITLLIALTLVASLYLENSSLLYYLYVIFPLFFWRWTLMNGKALGDILVENVGQTFSFGKNKSYFTSDDSSTSRHNVLIVVSSLIAIESLCLGYYYRELSTLGFLYFAVWPLRKNLPLNLKVFWVVICIFTSIFPLVPVDYGYSRNLVVLGGILIFISSLLSLTYPRISIFVHTEQPSSTHLTDESDFTLSSPRQKNVLQYLHIHRFFRIAQLFLLVLSIFLVIHTTYSLENKKGLPFINQVLSWSTLFLSVFSIVFPIPCHMIDHIVHIFTSLSTPFTLLSVSFELLFFFAFGIFLILWAILETRTSPISYNISKHSSSTITIHDLRRAVFYAFFCYIAFFGTGNIASISSFEISSTYRFTTIFNPFLMGALLIFKIIIPFIFVSCIYTALNWLLCIPSSACFLLVIGISDLMTMTFFFLVKDTGSWQSIGMSISHFGISNCLIIVQLILFGVSSLLMRSAKLSTNIWIKRHPQ